MKQLSEIMGRHAQNPFEPWDDNAVRAIAEEFATEVLDWVLTQTSYEKEEDNGEHWWGGFNRDFSSAELVEQYLKLPIIVQK